MFKRKLSALEYHAVDSFDVNDDSLFRNLIVWLEDQKIRHYKIEDRAGLRNVGSADWHNSFSKYLQDLGSVANSSDRNAVTDWILGYAVRLEYGDDVETYKTVTASKVQTQTSTQSTNPLDNLDFNDADFKAGVASLSTLLQIAPHQDHTLILKAICLLIKERFSKEGMERFKKTGTPKLKDIIPLDKVELGFVAGDYVTTDAAKILRLLHVRELRDLQTMINMAIVKVQEHTANPKTDSRLGKVGR